MSVVTFWSNLDKETGQTATAIAVATQMAIEHNYKILLLSTYNNSELDLAFWKIEKQKKSLLKLVDNKKVVSIDSGIVGLQKAYSSKRLTPEIITDYAKIVFKDRLEVLSGYDGTYAEYEKIKEIYPELIKMASKYYDLVIVDLNKGGNELSKQILGISNVIVYSINQKNTSIDEYIRIKQQAPKKNNIIPVIGRYDKYSKYNAKNISRYLKEKGGVNTSSYNTLFSEACDEGQVADFFLKMKTVGETDRNAHFLDEVRNISLSIIYKLKETQMKM